MAVATKTPDDSSDSGTNVNATEAAVQHAQELGVNIAQVEGSGVDGRITKADVAAHAAAQPEPEPIPTRTVPALDAMVGQKLGEGPKLAVSPTGETGFWYCLAPPQEHGGLGYLDKSRLFEAPIDKDNPACPTCPTCKKQQSCWVAHSLDVFPEGVLRLV